MLEFDEHYQDRDRLLQAWDFLEDFECPEEWIQHRAKICNLEQIDFENMDITGNAKPSKTLPKKKRRFRKLRFRRWRIR